MKILRLSNNVFEENCYLVVEKDEITIIDPGFNYVKIKEYITSNNLLLKRVFLTHGHIDHIADIDKISKDYPNVPIYINEQDIPFLYDSTLNVSKQSGMAKTYSDNMNIIPIFNETTIDGYRIYLTPGHTKGCILIEKGDYLFTGDTLFKGTIGRTDLPTGDIKEMEYSLKLISTSFSKDKKILPGHYDYSTLKDELKNNPYLKKKRR